MRRPSVITSASNTPQSRRSRPPSTFEEPQFVTNSWSSTAYAAVLSTPRQPAHPISSGGSSSISSSDEAEEEESDDDSIAASKVEGQRRWNWLQKLPSLTPLQRNILKCSIAYFIGSLFTFSPYLSGLISDLTSNGPSDGERTPSPAGHMVATVAVYYNPAKTMGAMLEADLFCFMGLLYVSLVSLASMSLFWFFEVQPGWEWLADFFVLFWVGLAMSVVAWLKVKVAKPSFNTACSMIAIIIFIVIVKEGGLEMFTQVATIVFIGASLSNIVCYSLWPQRATDNLQDTMVKSLNSFATLITMITQTFLLEEPVKKPSHEKLRVAIESHQASFTALKKNLAEAQSESWFGGPGRPSAKRSRTSSGQAYEDAIDSLNRLGQHLNGLRSGTSLQYELIEANKQGRLVLRNRSKKRATKISADGSKSQLADPFGPEIDGPFPSEDDILLQAAADTFGQLVDDLGPPLKALSTTCATSLKRLREAFDLPDGSRSSTIEPQDFRDLANALERALFTFESTSNHAILRMYRSGTASEPLETPAGNDENTLTGSQSENIFLVYFFIFTLQEFAKELISLVDAMSRICNIRRAEAERRGLWHTLTVPFVRLRARFSTFGPHSRLQERKARLGIRKRLSEYFVTPLAHTSVSFPKIKPHAPNTVQTPGRQELSFTGRVKQSIWALGARLKEQDLRYAIKAGMATAILAAPAFIESTRPIFVEYRGEWALISFFVVISPTIGATNFLGTHRVLGTLSGATTAASVWSAFPENPYVLSIFGFFFSMPCFYYIVAKPQYATSARFVLLTYNLTCLYCYNLRQEDVSIVEIASHRFTAVTVGVVWAAIVSRYWWPTEARRELSKGLGEFCLNVGWLYTRLVAFNSFDSETGFPHLESSTPPNETTSLLAASTNSQLNESIVEFMAMELHLQIKLIELQGLLAQTQHEPRLKGPFPIALYRSILTSLQTILDKLHSMRCVTSREEWHTEVRKDFIIPVNKERRDMVGNIILYFYVLASAFRLKSPLPPYLPPAEVSRQRLVEAIRQLDVIRNRDIRGSRQLLFFAYALTMQGITHELDYLGGVLQDAFGVIGGSTEAFDSFFRDRSQQVV
ncbi:Fusaric acid resistance protein-like-domain-containing protein [Cristinia sonorae]|uniref:Fusaric acid resistance protein-like-domain-containing protein n=1 Tax=Cristinia sonorae TaxID=1940300 RepID=A0A8K0XUR6_9AGAR|nr:Fusaric acid resistance protein-like-domain-containing protein [Cristinia sonorae]